MSNDASAPPVAGAELSRDAARRWGDAAASTPDPEREATPATQPEARPTQGLPSVDAASAATDSAPTPDDSAPTPDDSAPLPADAAPAPPDVTLVPADGTPVPANATRSPADLATAPADVAAAPADVAAAPADVAAAPADAAAAPADVLAAAADVAQSPADAASVSAAAEPDDDCLRLAEALVFASATPVTPRALSQLLPEAADADAVIAALRTRYAGRGVELAEAGGGIQFRTAPDLAPRLRKVIQVPRRLPRVAMETLAIVAYHQPCTRAEIEEIRGTSLSQQTLDALLEANLVAPKGRREVPGRPTLWGTTPQFLAQFGLKDIRDLPQRGDLLLEPPRPSGVSAAPPLTPELPEGPAASPADSSPADSPPAASPADSSPADSPPAASPADSPPADSPADSPAHAGVSGDAAASDRIADTGDSAATTEAAARTATHGAVTSDPAAADARAGAEADVPEPAAPGDGTLSPE